MFWLRETREEEYRSMLAVPVPRLRLISARPVNSCPGAVLVAAASLAAASVSWVIWAVPRTPREATWVARAAREAVANGMLVDIFWMLEPRPWIEDPVTADWAASDDIDCWKAA